MPYHTQTENYSLRGRDRRSVCVCVYVKYIRCCIYMLHVLHARQRGMRDMGGGKGEETGRGAERGKVDGGWRSGVVIMHAWREIKVTCFRIN